MELKDFGPDDPIGVGALVKLKSKGETGFYFLVPIAGGIEVKDGKKTILVITPQSPIGKLLVGHKAGERVRLETATPPKNLKSSVSGKPTKGFASARARRRIDHEPAERASTGQDGGASATHLGQSQRWGQEL